MATVRLVLSPSGEHTRPPGFHIFGSSKMFGHFSAGTNCRSLLSAGGHTESTPLLTGPGLVTWTLGCTFGTLLLLYSIRKHNF